MNALPAPLPGPSAPERPADTVLNAYHNPWHDPWVRRLAWLVGAPGLLDAADPRYAGRLVADAWGAAQLASAAAWLAELDRRPGALHDYLAIRPATRLGRMAEQLLEFWLRRAPGFEFLEANRRARRGRQVVGEYDLLFRAPGGAFCHWEATVKFYLQVDPRAGLSGFVGTLIHDRLDLKLDKLFDRQLRLPESDPELAAHYGAQPHSRAFIRGRLFYALEEILAQGDSLAPMDVPAGTDDGGRGGAVPAPARTGDRAPDQRAPSQTTDRLAGCSFPAGVSVRHERGWWARYPALNSAREAGLAAFPADSRWQVLAGPDWLAPCRLPPGGPACTSAEIGVQLDAHFAAHRRPLLLAEFAPDGRERSRGVVVTRDWPAGLERPGRMNDQTPGVQTPGAQPPGA